MDVSYAVHILSAFMWQWESWTVSEGPCGLCSLKFYYLALYRKRLSTPAKEETKVQFLICLSICPCICLFICLPIMVGHTTGFWASRHILWEGEFILLSVSCACKAWIKYLFFPTNIIHGFVVYANPENLSITSLPAFVFFCMLVF